ncbi:hypothetical protein DFH09DRAFT_1080922 [Mycena vulgaris]|nr:hypothetical protein DFH09DRAFT_1080922 [Mycena vulgaris]
MQQLVIAAPNLRSLMLECPISPFTLTSIWNGCSANLCSPGLRHLRLARVLSVSQKREPPPLDSHLAGCITIESLYIGSLAEGLEIWLSDVLCPLQFSRLTLLSIDSQITKLFSHPRFQQIQPMLRALDFTVVVLASLVHCSQLVTDVHWKENMPGFSQSAFPRLVILRITISHGAWQTAVRILSNILSSMRRIREIIIAQAGQERLDEGACRTLDAMLQDAASLELEMKEGDYAVWISHFPERSSKNMIRRTEPIPDDCRWLDDQCSPLHSRRELNLVLTPLIRTDVTHRRMILALVSILVGVILEWTHDRGRVTRAFRHAGRACLLSSGATSQGVRMLHASSFSEEADRHGGTGTYLGSYGVFVFLSLLLFYAHLATTMDSLATGMKKSTLNLDVQELVDQCIELVSGSVSDLKACALVHSTWTSTAQRHLFREIYLFLRYDDNPAPQKLVDALASSRPHLIPHIRRLHIKTHCPSVEMFPAICSAIYDEKISNLECVWIDGDIPDLSSPSVVAMQQLFSAPNLRRVILCDLANLSAFLNIWDRCSSNLRHLRLEDVLPRAKALPDLRKQAAGRLTIESLRVKSPSDALKKWLAHNDCPLDFSYLKPVSLDSHAALLSESRFAKAWQTVEALELTLHQKSRPFNLSLFPKLLLLRIIISHGGLPSATDILSTIARSNRIRKITIILNLPNSEACGTLDHKLSALPMSNFPLIELEGPPVHDQWIPHFPELSSTNMIRRTDPKHGHRWFDYYVLSQCSRFRVISVTSVEPMFTSLSRFLASMM